MIGEVVDVGCFGDQFFPSAQRALAGPWISTYRNAVQLGELPAGLVDQLMNISPGRPSSYSPTVIYPSWPAMLNL